MPSYQIQDDDEVILVDFAPAPGVRSVSYSPQDVIEKSKQAIDDAMKSIQSMADKTMKTIKSIPISERPNTISVSFGLKLDAEVGAMVAKAGMEAAINVTMTWHHTPTSSAKAKTRHN